MQLVKVTTVHIHSNKEEDLTINIEKISSLQDKNFNGRQIIECYMGDRVIYLRFNGKVKHFIESIVPLKKSRTTLNRTLEAGIRRLKEWESENPGTIAIEGVEWQRY